MTWVEDWRLCPNDAGTAEWYSYSRIRLDEWSTRFVVRYIGTPEYRPVDGIMRVYHQRGSHERLNRAHYYGASRNEVSKDAQLWAEKMRWWQTRMRAAEARDRTLRVFRERYRRGEIGWVDLCVNVSGALQVRTGAELMLLLGDLLDAEVEDSERKRLQPAE